jgi:1-acylglycerone phosphate reductase
MDIDKVRALFEVNVIAPVRMVQEFIHLLIASGDGRIALASSVSGIMPVPFGGAYNASKAALTSFGNTLRVELAPFKYGLFRFCGYRSTLLTTFFVSIKVVNVRYHHILAIAKTLTFSLYLKLMTGNVRSNIAKPTTMPSTSLYKDMATVYEEKVIYRSQSTSSRQSLFSVRRHAQLYTRLLRGGNGHGRVCSRRRLRNPQATAARMVLGGQQDMGLLDYRHLPVVI